MTTWSSTTMVEPVGDNPAFEDGMTEKLYRVIDRVLPGAVVEGLTRLTGGASQQMWSLDAVTTKERLGLVLRQAGAWHAGAAGTLALDDEARLLARAGETGIPVPLVHYILRPEDGLGVGYLMTRVAGETLPGKILKAPRYASARQRLADQCGRVLAAIHRLDAAGLDFLPRATPVAVLDGLQREYQDHGEPRPVFELAFRWLRDNLPAEPERLVVVHGDFRHGNLMVDEDGLVAVLDWELACLGDPMADLGWITINAWRFGNIDLPVGGFGTRTQLFAGYQAASGVRPDPDRVRFWEILGTLRWGVICQRMAASFVAGQDTSPERGAIGRRASEAEVYLLRELVPLRN